MIRILTVCTGNICRSPLAAQLLHAKLPSENFEIRSAGISVLAGDHTPEAAQQVATSLGISGADEHRAVALATAAVSQAELIFGMERLHRRTAAQADPTAGSRAFTLLEFAHIVSEVSDAQIQTFMHEDVDPEMAALNAVTRMRGVVPRLPDERFYDVEDPYGRSRRAYQRSALQIVSAVDQIVAYFGRVTELRQRFRTESLHFRAPQSAVIQQIQTKNGVT